MTRPATEKEIRAYFKANGQKCRISWDEDGKRRILYRENDGEWLDGTWVHFYRFDDDYGVVL